MTAAEQLARVVAAMREALEHQPENTAEAADETVRLLRDEQQTWPRGE